MKKFQPKSDRVYVRPLRASQEKRHGLAVPTSQEKEPTQGIVLAVGLRARRHINSVIKLEDGYEVGDHICWREYSGYTITDPQTGEECRILRVEEIDGCIVEEEEKT